MKNYYIIIVFSFVASFALTSAVFSNSTSKEEKNFKILPSVKVESLERNTVISNNKAKNVESESLVCRATCNILHN